MIWLTWRQFRVQAAVVAGVLALVAIVAAVTGPHLVDLYDACKSTHTCGQSSLNVADNRLQVALQAALLVAPALIGIFWGAPLVARELETGTYRLGWTQSVTRRRWLAAKVGLVGLSAIVLGGLLSLLVTWWFSPIDAVTANRFSSLQFGVRGITPIGYAAFAFAIGVTAGVLMRRTLPAMATTLVAYLFARLAETAWVRPHLLPPTHTKLALQANDVGFGISPAGAQVVANPPNIPNAWVYSGDIVNNSGQAPTAAFIKTACPNLPTGAPTGATGVSAVHVKAGGPGGPPAAFQDCIAKVAAHYHEVVTYQPASRYWAFQGLETGLFLVLSLALLGATFWWVRHRLA